MEEINSILLMGVTATTEEQINHVETSLDAYEMQLEFVKAIFEIISSSDNSSVKLFASTYICVKFQNNFQSIPADSVEFTLQNFPNLFFSVGEELSAYYKKFMYTLCLRGYIPQLQTTSILTDFLAFFNSPEMIRNASVLIYQLSKASIRISSKNAEDCPSFFIFMTAIEQFHQILAECEDPFVKSNIMKSIVLLHRGFASSICKEIDTELEGRVAEIINSFIPIFEVLVPILDNTECDCYIKYFKDFSAFFNFVVKIVPLPHEFVVSVLDVIFTKTMELKDERITKIFFNFTDIILAKESPEILEFYSDKLQAITDELILPLYVLTPEAIEEATENPVEFAHNNIYDQLEDVAQSKSVTCIKRLCSVYPDYDELIVQYAQQAIEKFAGDNDSSALYAVLHFCSRRWCQLLELSLEDDNGDKAAIIEQALQLTVESAGIFESCDILAICAYLLLISDFHIQKPPVLPTELTLACIQQIGSESELVQYYACSAINSQLRTIINSKESIDSLGQGVDFNGAEFMQTVFQISSNFGEPRLNCIISYCSKIPVFKDIIMECAPSIIDYTFDLAEECVEQEKDSLSDDDYSTNFKNLMNIIDLIKDQPEALNSITKYIIEKIGEHSNLFDSVFEEYLVCLVNQIILLSVDAQESFFELAKVLFEKIGVSNVDVADNIAIIIHNLFISNLEGCDLEWLYQAIVKTREMRQAGAYAYSLLLATALKCFPPELEAQMEVFQFAIEVVSFFGADDIYDLEDISELLYVLFVKFPEQTMATLPEPLDYLNGIAFQHTADAIEVCIAVYSFIDTESWVEIVKEILELAEPSEIFLCNNINEYALDNLIVSIPPINPRSEEERLGSIVEFFTKLIEENKEIADQSFITRFMFKLQNPEKNEGEE